MNPATGMLIDGVFGSAATDSSAEVLDVEGCDISDWKKGTILLNWEHEPGAKGANTLVGKVTYAHKIYERSDCEDDRQRHYWDDLKIPFIYGRARLFDGAGHANAKSIAAIIRDHVANDEPVVCRYSVEGQTLLREKNVLKHTIIKRVAVTVSPCNHTAVSGLISDPNAPDGFSKNPSLRDSKDSFADARKNEYVNLEYQPLGVSVTCKFVPFRKTNAAPSTLTGQAALAREDVSFTREKIRKVFKVQLLEALRDYSKEHRYEKLEFRSFLKHRLPDVSEEYIDHFTDIADETFAIKKREAESVATKAPATKAPATKAPATKAPATKAPATKAPAKVAVKAPETKEKIISNEKPSFDENAGVLHAGGVAHKLYIPDHERFNRILSEPKAGEVHDKAMEGWVKVHKLAKERRLPPEVVMHATLFSNLSPNTPVPMQEHMYAKLVDAMHETGVDAREPNFAEKVKDTWTRIDQPDQLSTHSREHFENHPGIRLKQKSKANGRDPGDIAGYMLANNKMKNMDRYHEIHHPLVDLVNRHGADGRSAVAELMESKDLSEKWNDRRVNALAAGKEDLGEYPGISVPGLAPKTARYTMGMLGAGNVFVPDTHFVRHIMGLQNGKDSDTLGSLKENIFWNPQHSNVLGGIDRWYAKNHPAVQHMLQHPKWGQHFEKPEDAIFPAFWKHWMGILPDERERGMAGQGYNEGTTHAPYWDAIDPFVEHALQKSEDATELAQKTARVHAQYVKDYGEVPATMLYYRFLAPQLLAHAERRESAKKYKNLLKSQIRLQHLEVELKKAVQEVQTPWTPPEVQHVQFKVGDDLHSAGRYMIHNDAIHHLEDHYGMLGRFLPEGPVDEVAISRIHGLKSAPHIKIEQHHPDLPSLDAQQSANEAAEGLAPVTRPPSVFDYHRVGHSSPNVLEVTKEGTYVLDGRPVPADGIGTMLANARNGLATLRYRNSATTKMVQKMEVALEDLLKAEDMDPASALHHIRAAVAAGHVHPSVERALTAHIYQDPMTGLGNKYAATEFLKQNKPGVYMSLDGNDFSAVNNAFGHETGDHAIKAMGGAVREAMNEAVGQEHGKAFRNGGDEIVLHVPSFEHAAKFSRALSEKMEKIPPVNGVHKLSMGIGIGHDFHSADKALSHAKDQKYHPEQDHIPQRQRTRIHPVGQSPTMVHSLIHAKEGPVPISGGPSAALAHVNNLPTTPTTPTPPKIDVPSSSA